MRNKDAFFIQMATLVSEQSSCCRVKVGSVLVRDTRVISIGYNGTPKAQIHCEDFFKKLYKQKYSKKYKNLEAYKKSQTFFDEHGQWSIKYELHAEQNAISFAAKHGIRTEDADLYITLAPCVSCAKTIIASGIKRVFYKEPYDRSQDGLDFLKNNGIKCKQVKG